MDYAAHGGAHSSHTEHSGHEGLFRQRFWVCLVLSVPVLLYSPMLQEWFGFSMPAFLGSQWIGPLFALIVFGYGGVPFLQMAVSEIRSHQPGMMPLFGWLLNPIFAAAAMAFSSVFVVTNSLRLRGFRPRLVP